MDAIDRLPLSCPELPTRLFLLPDTQNPSSESNSSVLHSLIASEGNGSIIDLHWNSNHKARLTISWRVIVVLRSPFVIVGHCKSEFVDVLGTLWLTNSLFAVSLLCRWVAMDHFLLRLDGWPTRGELPNVTISGPCEDPTGLVV